MPRLRRQLTLFVPAPARELLEDLRRELDPAQHARIAAHVTLCREDEFSAADVARGGERAATAPPLTLAFGAPERFDGHGVLLRCRDGADAFAALRRAMLARDDVRPHGAHVTLAHPRNPRAPGNTDAALARAPTAFACTFAAIDLIEQVDDGPWRVLAHWPLAAPSRPTA